MGLSLIKALATILPSLEYIQGMGLCLKALESLRLEGVFEMDRYLPIGRCMACTGNSIALPESHFSSILCIDNAAPVWV